MDDALTEKVLRCVEQVPAGRVVAYGDVARIVGTGPRVVGRVMAEWGSNVPWWRVVNASGNLPEHKPRGPWVAHWREEGISFRPDGRGCRISDYRADLGRLEQDWAAAVQDLARADGGAADDGAADDPA
jgi:methylated-DNA-protein-cysteine methyltransferase related protein